MTCQGVNKNGVSCNNVHYIGETSRSIGERFKEHFTVYNHEKQSVREKSVFFHHVKDCHNGQNQPIKLEIEARFPGNAALRQAAEAVSIRDTKPILNGKEENTNQPRRRKERTESDVNRRQNQGNV